MDIDSVKEKQVSERSEQPLPPNGSAGAGEAMDVDKAVNGDKPAENAGDNATETANDMDTDKADDSEKASEARRQFSLSREVDWTPTSKTATSQMHSNGEDAEFPSTPRDPLPYHSYHDKPPPVRIARPSSEDREAPFSAPPPMAPRLIARGPRSGDSASPSGEGSISAGGKPRQAKSDVAEPISSRTTGRRAAAARSRIVTTKQVQYDSEEDDGEDEVEWDRDEPEEEEGAPEKKTASPSKPKSKAAGGTEDVYDELEDEEEEVVTKKRGRPPGSATKAQKKRKTGDRYPCTVEGCTKTFTRRNDVERHMKSSAAHPELKNADDTKKCGLCGTDLSRADARLRHERTNACGKRNLQQARTKSTSSIPKSPTRPKP